MKLMVAGCSFSAVSQSQPGSAWSERLAEKLGNWELVNLARQGCSNGGIRIQMDEIRRQRPDFAVIHMSSCVCRDSQPAFFCCPGVHFRNQRKC